MKNWFHFLKKLEAGEKLSSLLKMNHWNSVYTWLLQWQTLGEPVSGPILCKKALILNEKLGGNSDFKANVWLAKNFKNRHSIRQLDIEEEHFSSDGNTAESFKKTFEDFVTAEELEPDVIIALMKLVYIGRLGLQKL